ncbi:MAG: histidine kinase [Burkholderiales bacterium RIFCSPLOWO2_02_FULL_57_36]|nr:MAG: histidine kinase [Burkholderiales bacterium RIFCSPLOWO2_02_FULL_57_36]
MPLRIINLGISSEQDVVLIRQRARQISASLGFGSQDQVRIATAVSELSRTAFAYASGGNVEFAVDGLHRAQVLLIKIKSTGGEFRDMGSAPGVEPMPDAGLNAALISAHRLMDRCTVDDEAGRATVITLCKSLPTGISINTDTLAESVRRISVSPISNTFSEVALQNKELLDTLAELRTKQDDLLALTKELEDTNRGVVALYAEIEEKAERLRQADEMKSRFLSNTSHELRTPLSSIRALSGLLLDRVDGELTDEQEKQIRFIEQAATDLSELVNDLLDLAKIESGKVYIEPAIFAVSDLFSALRGMLRPIAAMPGVELIFDDPIDELFIHTDEGKVAQILRNFVSNALKFTETGIVKVSTTRDEASGDIRFIVKDTGIGIAPEDQQFVFEEFSQIEHPLQRRSKGTGLGLPLCRKLAHLLGGEVTLSSTPGIGSEFSLVLPAQRPPA